MLGELDHTRHGPPNSGEMNMKPLKTTENLRNSFVESVKPTEMRHLRELKTIPANLVVEAGSQHHL